VEGEEWRCREKRGGGGRREEVEGEERRWREKRGSGGENIGKVGGGAEEH